MLTRLRDVLHRAITTDRGDAVAAVRVPKDLARRLNAALGAPLAAREELERRAQARARLAALRSAAPAAAANSVATEQPPVIVYFEKDRNVRELARIEELLGTRGITWKRLDVSGDEATLDFVVRRAKCERDGLPVVFVADQPIGGYAKLVQADASDELLRLAVPSARP